MSDTEISQSQPDQPPRMLRDDSVSITSQDTDQLLDRTAAEKLEVHEQYAIHQAAHDQAVTALAVEGTVAIVSDARLAALLTDPTIVGALRMGIDKAVRRAYFAGYATHYVEGLPPVLEEPPTLPPEEDFILEFTPETEPEPPLPAMVHEFLSVYNQQPPSGSKERDQNVWRKRLYETTFDALDTYCQLPEPAGPINRTAHDAIARAYTYLCLDHNAYPLDDGLLRQAHVSKAKLGIVFKEAVINAFVNKSSKSRKEITASMERYTTPEELATYLNMHEGLWKDIVEVKVHELQQQLEERDS